MAPEHLHKCPFFTQHGHKHARRHDADRRIERRSIDSSQRGLIASDALISFSYYLNGK